jgi:tetratricopeptide (TPR) repeat protein
VPTGRALFARAHALAPSHATAWQWNGEGLIYAGDMEGAVVATRRATQLDPKSAVVRQAHANALFAAGRDAEGVVVCESVLKDFPNWLNCHLLKYDAAVVAKDHASARALLLDLASSRGPEAARFAEQMSDVAEGRGDARAVAQRPATMADGTIDLASLSPLGDADAIIYGIAIGQPVALLPRIRSFQARLPYNLRGQLLDVHADGLHCLPEFAPVIAELRINAATSAARCARFKQPHRAPMAPPKKS